MADKSLVSGFWADAEELLRVAAVDSDAEFVPADLALILDAEGGVRLIDAAGWQTHALADHFGARTVYRIRRDDSRVRVEGSCGARSCALAMERRATRAGRMPGASALFPRQRLLEAGTPQNE